MLYNARIIKIKNSVNHVEIEKLFRIERFSSVFGEMETEKITDMFSKVNYNISSSESSQLKISDRLFDFVKTSALSALNKADDRAFNIFIDSIYTNSYQQYIVVLIIFGMIFLQIFQCLFLPMTYDVYKRRNKKSRKQEARMSKKTLCIHLGLHAVTTLVMMLFVIIFYISVNDFYDKTNTTSFHFLKYTNNYYLSLRLFQADDLRNIFTSTPLHPNITLDTTYRQQFLQSSKTLLNNYQFQIKFPQLKDLYMKYQFNIDCNYDVIQQNIQSTILCKKYENESQKLKLSYQVKTQAPSRDKIQYKTIYEESMIYDHFQIQYCHDISRKIKQAMDEYISTVSEEVILFFSKIIVCIVFLLLFWVPFFKDRDKYKKEAQRFEMINQL